MLINQQVEAQDVPNPYSFLPSINTQDLIDTMRVDKTMGTPRIAEYIMTAYDNINRQLCCKYLRPGFWINPPAQFGRACLNISHWQRTYQRAVRYEASALMADDYLDFDTTGSGLARGENTLQKSDRLRRIVNHCIADLTDKPRNRVRLV